MHDRQFHIQADCTRTETNNIYSMQVQDFEWKKVSQNKLATFMLLDVTGSM